MRNRIKRFLAMLLAVILLIGAVFTEDFLTVHAENGKGTINFIITDSDGTVNDATVKLKLGDSEDEIEWENSETELEPGTYSYTISKDYYEDSTGTVEVVGDQVTDKNVTLERKTITANFYVYGYDGNGLSGVEVYSGDTCVTESDADGKITVTVNQGCTYSFELKCDGYENQTISGEATNVLSIANVNMGDKTKSVSINVKYYDTKLTGAKVTFVAEDNSSTVTAIEENGTYHANLSVGKKYKVNTSCTGFEFETGEYEVSEDNEEPYDIVTNTIKDIVISRPTTNLVKYGSNETIQIVIEEKIASTQKEFEYVFVSSNEEIITVDENGIVSAVKAGEATVSVQCKYNGNVVLSSEPLSLEIEKGDSSSLTIEEVTESDADATEVKFKLKNVSENDASVTITAKGDCLSNGGITFNKDITSGDTTITCDYSGALKKTYTCLQGEITYHVVYNGVNLEDKTFDFPSKYYVNKDLTCKIVSVEGDKQEDVKLDDLVYGDNRELKIVAEEGRSFTYSVEDEQDNEIDILDIDDDGKITIKNAGTAIIKITRDLDDENYWAAKTTELEVTVNPKVINPLNPDVIVFKSELSENIYDKNNDKITVNGKVQENNEGIEAGDSLTISAKLKLPSSDAGTYDASKEEIKVSKWELTSETNNYVLPEIIEGKEPSIKEGTYTISPRELYIDVIGNNTPGISDNYGTLNYGDMTTKSSLVPEDIEIYVRNTCENDVVFGEDDDFDYKNNPISDNSILQIEPIEGIHDVYPDEKPVHEGVLVVDIETANNVITQNTKGEKNYKFSDQGNTWADLKVETETISDNAEALSNILQYNCEYVSDVEEGYIPWVKENGGTLSIAIKSDTDQSTRYDTVIYKSDDGTIIDFVNEISSDSLKNIISDSGISVYLAKTDENKGYKNLSEAFTIPVRLDGTVPTVNFVNGLVETVSSTAQVAKSITFGIFDNAVYTAQFEITDTESGFTPTEIKSYVWKLEDDDLDLESGEISVDKINEKIQSGFVWDDVSNDQEVKTKTTVTYDVPVAVDHSGNADVIEGSYLVLIKAVDNVGNEKIYASNGIVIDVEAPVIDISFADVKTYYNADVEYSIKVTEKENALGVSGVAKVVWEVCCDGNPVERNSGEYSLNKEEENPQYSIADLHVKYNETHTIYTKDESGNDICNSNNITLVVTAFDRAGNEIALKEYHIMIDTTLPEITVAYDLNEESVQNDLYFQKARTATITFKERNFDKNNATFDIGLEGKEVQTCTLAELNALDDIEAEWLSDTQSDVVDEKDYTDDRENVAVIKFNADNHYTFLPHCVDKAGNTNEGVSYAKGTVAPTEFVIDNTDPAISVEYTVDTEDGTLVVGKEEAARVYKNKTITAKVTLIEHNFSYEDRFADNQVKYAVEVSKTKEGQTMPDYANDANTVTYWNGNGDTKEAVFTYSNDGNYTTNFVYTDLSGRTATLTNDYFTVDKTVPTGSVKVGSRNPVVEFLNSITFYLFSDTTIPVSFSGADTTSPINYIGYYIAKEPLSSKEDVKAIISWTEGTAYNVNPDSQVVPYLKVVDKAGNVEYFSSDSIAISDNTDPKDTTKPMITITTAQPVHDIYNGNVSFSMHAEDPVVGGTYSGLSKVEYQILNNGAKTEGNTYTLNSQNHNGNRVFDSNEVVTASVNNSNHVQIRVIATDNAGNVAEEIKDIKIDVTAPEIAVTYNTNDALNGKYYKDTRVATVVIKERNFDPNNVQINVTNSDGTPATISGWTHSANSGESDAATHTATITFSADGDYKFTVDCTDLAMNKASNPYTSEEFTIDKTTPVINVSYDNNSAQNGNYYKATRTATITITEHNFNASDVQVSTTASNGSAPRVSGWSTSGDRHTATVYFGSDAEYTFDVSYTDLAGNAAADYSQDSFIVDLTNPTVEISGVANKSANKGTVAPTITLDDTNFTAGGVTITLKGAKKGNIDVSSMVSRTSTATGQVISFQNFADSMDDIYTLTATSMDKAGNETTQTITFSVNRHGSTYAFGDETKKLLEDKNGYTNTPVDIVIEEINVDTLEFVELSYSKDGKIVKLTEGKDYTVKVDGTDGQWKKYIYTIKASCFEEEGEYNIDIYSVDRAQNESSNKVQSVNVEFVVDKTAPTMAISNLEHLKTYDENTHQFTLNVKDNAKVSRVELYLDGKLVHTYEGDELVIENGKIYIDVESQETYQTVKLIAYDEAGNATEPVEYTVLVTTNRWIQFVANKPLFYGTIIVLVLAIFFILFLIWKKRKKDEEEEQAKKAAKR